MRCKACDAELTDTEAVRKSLNTKEYLDLCSPCLETIAEDVLYLDNPLVEILDLGDLGVQDNSTKE